MQPREERAAEPKALTGTFAFEEGDFHALSEGLCRDPQFNDRRLVTRRKLLALGKSAVREAKELGATLEARSSTHNPHPFNQMRVRRIWAYLMRSKAEKKRLRSTLGADLAKDLDAAYRNAYLCLAVEAEAVEVSLRIHVDAWYDGRNLVRRVTREGEDGLGEWLAELNKLDGFRLQLHDWKGEWRCGELTRERLEEFLSYYTPGEHALAVQYRLPAPPGARGAALDADLPARMVAELMRLVPLYRFTAWSKESDFLFG